MISEQSCELKGDIFNLKKLHHLKIVNNHTDLKANTHYWMVYSPHGVVLSNWKTKVKVLEVFEMELKETLVFAECCIMDGNYTFRQLYEYNEYTFFEYE